MRPLHLLLPILVLSFPSPGIQAAEKWLPGPAAKKVLGQPDFETESVVEDEQGLSDPWDVEIDPTSGKVFVADANHSRVLRYASYEALANHAPAEAVFGQADFDVSVNAAGKKGLFNPRGIFIDHTGTLWVADFRNHRVLWYENASSAMSHPDADGVIGKPDFDDTDSGLTASRIGFPYDVVVDRNGNLFVCSSANDRVLMFPDAKANGSSASATLVLGQEGFEVAGENSDDDGMWAPTGLEIDSAGNLYVSDVGNHRGLRFDNAALKNDGDPADAVFGQTGLNVPSPGSGGGAKGLSSPRDMIVDGSGTLWIADDGNNRVVGFVSPTSVTTDPSATYVIGQPDLDTSVSGLDDKSLDNPKGLGVDAA
ncbi:MAG: NHL repeat-containing protein, partial [Verrucomicrobiota bacterium]